MEKYFYTNEMDVPQKVIKIYNVLEFAGKDRKHLNSRTIHQELYVMYSPLPKTAI